MAAGAQQTKAGGSGKFVVWTSEGYFPDGFHAPQPFVKEPVSWHNTVAAANKAVQAAYKKNPWGISPAELELRGYLNVSQTGLGLEQRSYSSADVPEYWRVGGELASEFDPRPGEW